MDLSPWRQNNIWKLLWNDSGVIVDLLESDAGPLLIVKVNIEDMS